LSNTNRVSWLELPALNVQVEYDPGYIVI